MNKIKLTGACTSKRNTIKWKIAFSFMLTAGNNDQLRDELVRKTGEKFEIKDLGGAKHYLGIDIEKDKYGRFMISQPLYIDKTIHEA